MSEGESSGNKPITRGSRGKSVKTESKCNIYIYIYICAMFSDLLYNKSLFLIYFYLFRKR